MLHGGLPAYFTSFSQIAFMILVFTKLVLCVQLVRNYAGKIRLFGASFFGCQVLMWVFDLVYLFVYTCVGGATMSDISSIYIFTSLLNFALVLVPFCVLRTTMVKND